jgi:DNA-binding transcriptional MerR regulator
LQAGVVAQDRELIPIGRFARLANLSPRQLRYYHALGLLPPAAVDPRSGYRYYAETQRATAELIALLRSVDMPVPEIQSLLPDRSPANVRQVFDRLRAAVEDRLRHARQILDRLDTLTLEGSLMERQQATMYPYEAFTDESREVLQLTQRLADEAGHDTIGPEHMLAALASESAGAAGAALRRLGLDTETIAAAVSAARPAEAGTDPPVPDVALRDVVAGAFADAGVDPANAGDRVIDTANLLRRTVAVEGTAAVLRRLDVEPARVLRELDA